MAMFGRPMALFWTCFLVTAFLTISSAHLLNTQGLHLSPFSGQINELSLNPLILVDDDNQYQFNFEQTIDHATSDSGTFFQRYFVNTDYWDKNSEVHFLFLEGAVVARGSRVFDLNSPFVVAAIANNASICRPYEKATTANLALLTTEQALQDIVNFIQTQNLKLSQKNPKWIVYGGAYSAALALWLRQKYPDLTTGVVASSPPSVPALDFYKFQKNVEDAYAFYDPQAYENFRKLIANISHLMQNDQGRQLLSQKLSLTPGFDQFQLKSSVLQNFFNTLAFFFKMPKFSIANASKILNSNVDDLTKVQQIIFGDFGIKNSDSAAVSIPNNYTDIVEFLQTENYMNDGTNLNYRNFLYQQCTQLGYFVTTDYGSVAFDANVPNNYWLNLCTDVFGKDFDIKKLEAGVKNTVKLYGNSLNYTASNTVITIGAVDPWRTLSPKAVTNATSFLFSIADVGQSADLQPIASDETYTITFARKAIARYVKNWISSANRNKKRKSHEYNLFNAASESTDFEKPIENKEIHNWDAEIEWDVEYPVKKPSKKLTKTQKLIRNRIRRRHLLRMPTFANNKSYEKAKAATITQNLDQFSSTNKNTWKQAFLFLNR